MKIPPRRLPISFGPVQGELLGSYLHRLADANRISVGVITAVISEELPTSCNREQDTLSGWSPSCLADLARLTGRTVANLDRALFQFKDLQPSLPILHRAPLPELTRRWRTAACRCCTAKHGIRGLAIRRTLPHESVCLVHRRWLPSEEQFRLDALPAMLRANRRHRRMASRHDPLAFGLAYINISHQLRRWCETKAQPELQERWTQRLALLGEDPYGNPNLPSRQRAALVVYPEAVSLTGLLTNRLLPPSRLSQAVERRLGIRLDLLPRREVATFIETSLASISAKMTSASSGPPFHA
ncbi:TniQ family protein [Nonomuraea spiralis]|uniref:TniQ family protein n=1 Tax=Nonomuraea spiralis TaxID=46182 RepID=A0ABV5ISE1_9ACTN|nr:TniQ family protein [Nonomuraea spiralis]GGT40718.1 hypothetical protein GCM10010176_100640 [Nonomuraea spiralis]